MRIIDGKICAQVVKDKIAKEVAEIKAKGQRPPRLDIFLVDLNVFRLFYFFLFYLLNFFLFRIIYFYFAV